MHTSEYALVKPQWFTILERHGAWKAGRVMYSNPDQTKLVKTVGAAILLAVAIGVACACGWDLAGEAIKAVRGR